MPVLLVQTTVSYTAMQLGHSHDYVITSSIFKFNIHYETNER